MSRGIVYNKKMFKKILIFVVVLVGVGFVGFLYLVRPVAEPSVDVSETGNGLMTESVEAKVFKIVAGESNAQFVIDEVLKGKNNTVVGSTGEIGGEILLDLKNPANSKIGDIKINARTLKTDNQNRDGAIARLVLRSERPENEIIVFKTTELSRMPSEIVVGEEFIFKISGDLTISGVTRAVIFDAKTKLISEKELTGSATATMPYKDFGLSIPQVPSVASVEDQVILKAQITAHSNELTD